MTDPKAKPLWKAINDIVTIGELHHIESSNSVIVSEVAEGSLTELVRKKLIELINCHKPEANTDKKLLAGGTFNGQPCQIQLWEQTSSQDGNSELSK